MVCVCVGGGGRPGSAPVTSQHRGTNTTPTQYQNVYCTDIRRGLHFTHSAANIKRDISMSWV